MKETKKMLGVIEAQYRKANAEYQKQQQDKLKKECRREFWLGALLFFNIMLLITIIGSL